MEEKRKFAKILKLKEEHMAIKNRDYYMSDFELLPVYIYPDGTIKELNVRNILIVIKNGERNILKMQLWRI